MAEFKDRLKSLRTERDISMRDLEKVGKVVSV